MASETALCLDALTTLAARVNARLRERFAPTGKLDGKALTAGQLAAHGYAYLEMELEASRQLTRWADAGGESEARIAGAYVGEVVRALAGGVDLGPAETVSTAELGLTREDLEETVLRFDVRAAAEALSTGERYLEIARAAAEGDFGKRSHDDPTLEEVRRQFARFADTVVAPAAQQIHREDVLIPMSMLEQMSELGVFGLTIPEEYDGLGMGKVAMCVVTEELSRGYIGVGSLGTRAEIAAELILGGGTEEQKKRWLPRIASGEVLPTAVFTEPNFGSDLANLGTRAEATADGFLVYGQKTWITHAARADLMTLLARTDSGKPGYRGLSMFLAEKRRGGEGAEEFPDAGITGTEIEVLGYRGMKEYELSFDGFSLPADALLGGEAGQGFKQLMRTFESARIQTAARGVGVAQAALEDALRYAEERQQFGAPLLALPRVARKLGRMVARVQAARQLAHFSARQKDSGQRCDLEAGMAKLLATRAAWECADANVQIHGGNGYAVEYVASRLLVDARVLSIFEGANEIQAHVVARRLLES